MKLYSKFAKFTYYKTFIDKCLHVLSPKVLSKIVAYNILFFFKLFFSKNKAHNSNGIWSLLCSPPKERGHIVLGVDPACWHWHWCQHYFLVCTISCESVLGFLPNFHGYMGHSKELRRFWWLWSNFQGHSSINMENSVGGHLFYLKTLLLVFSEKYQKKKKKKKDSNVICCSCENCFKD